MSGGNNVRLERGFSISRGVWYPSSSSINYSQWQHIAVTYNEDDISNDPVIYINGVAQSLTEQEDPNGTASSDAAQKIAIGNRVESSSFDGLIDEVIIYNDALTAEQVYQLYLEGINNHTNSTITASETTIGETWTCSVTPNDATEDGTTLNNTLTVQEEAGTGTWANSSFDRCMNITITNSGSETLTNFPAYINLTYDSDMQPDFLDIRFYSAGCNNGGTALDYEIENYTTSTNAHTWTRIQSLQSTGTTISVYYKNNTAVTSGENPA